MLNDEISPDEDERTMMDRMFDESRISKRKKAASGTDPTGQEKATAKSAKKMTNLPSFMINKRGYIMLYPPPTQRGVGFVNPAGTMSCYINSVFQILFHIPAVLENLVEITPERETRGETALPLGNCALD